MSNWKTIWARDNTQEQRREAEEFYGRERKHITKHYPHLVYIHKVQDKIILIASTSYLYGIRQYTNRPDKWKELVSYNEGNFRVEILWHNILNKELARSIAKAATYWYANREPENCNFIDIANPKEGTSERVKELMLISTDVKDFLRQLYEKQMKVEEIYSSKLYLEINTNERNYKMFFAN